MGAPAPGKGGTNEKTTQLRGDQQAAPGEGAKTEGAKSDEDRGGKDDRRGRSLYSRLIMCVGKRCIPLLPDRRTAVKTRRRSQTIPWCLSLPDNRRRARYHERNPETARR